MDEEIQDQVEDVEVVIEQPDEQPEEQPDEQAEQRTERRQETPEAKRARLQRELDRLNKKYPEHKESKQVTNKSDFDYGELAFLAAKGVEADDEISFVQQIIANTGRTLREVVSDDYVQSKLKSMREARTVEDAVPKGTKRSGTQARDNVDYWIAKNELPDDVDLRRKVVNERIRRETQRDVFGS